MRWLIIGLISGLVAFMLMHRHAHATWKPEYGKTDPEVQQWFKEQNVMPEAQPRIGFSLCCDHSDKVKTYFSSSENKDAWFYYDPECAERLGDDIKAIKKECKSIRIPDDVIHHEDIPIGHSPQAQEEFNQMRSEGVMMVYTNPRFPNGVITCFWPPQTGI